MKTTKNLPRKEWFQYRQVPEPEMVKAAQWILSRPEHDMDTCVDGGISRWSLIITDHGIATTYAIRDNSDGAIFEVPVSLEELNP